MTENDGGPAFPGEQGSTPEGEWNQTWEPGMSLRDWFGGQVLPEWVRAHIEQSVDDVSKTDIAIECYSYADAMLAARDQPAAVPAPSSDLLAAAEAVVSQTNPTAAYLLHDRLIRAVEAEKERAEADHA